MADDGVEYPEFFTEAGIIHTIELTNFMNHAHLKLDLSPNVNFLVGNNGSGKSAVLVGLVTCLGAAARFSNRSSKIGDLVRNGCHSATIRITLLNEGPEAWRPEAYGPRITIERRIVREGGGGYALRDVNGKKVSSTREELDNILEQFNLQVENPCTVLMQDASKMFLTSNKPEKKYELFLAATQLEQMKADLEETGSHLKLAESTVLTKQESLVDMEDKLKVLEGKVTLLKQVERHRLQVKEMRSKLAWAHVHVRETELESIEAEMMKTEEQHAKLVEGKAQRQAATDAMRKDQEKLQAKLEEHKTETHRLTLQSHAIEEEEKRFARQKATYEVELGDFKAEHARLRKRKDNLLDRIVKAQSTGRGDNKAAQYAKNLEKAKQKRATVDKLEAEQADLAARQPALEEEAKTDEEALLSLQHKLAALERELEKWDGEVRRFSAAAKDRVAAFGQTAPEVIKIIQANATRFKKRPIGPIGMSVTLLEEEWANAVDLEIGKQLDKFIVASVDDLKLLQSLTKGLKKPPQIIVANFNTPRYELRPQSLPPPKYKTLLSVIKIDDPICFNALIDDGKPDRTLLFRTYEEARQAMFFDNGLNGPDNVNEAFSLEKNMTFNITFGTQITKGHKTPTSNRLQLDFSAALENAKMRANDAKGRLGPVRAEYQQVKTRFDRTSKSVKHGEVRLAQIPTEVERLKSEIEELEKPPEVEPERAAEVASLQAGLPDLEEQMNTASASIKEAQDRLSDFLKTMEPVAARRRDMERQAGVIDGLLEATNKELDHLTNALNQNLQRIPRFDEALVKLEETKRQQNEKHVAQTQLVEEYCVKAQFFSKRPSEPVTTPPEIISTQIENMEAMIAQQQREDGLDQSVLDEYEAVKKAISELKATIDDTLYSINLAHNMLAVRAKTWVKFRNSVGHRTKMLFVAYLSYRNFQGDLVFDHKAKTLGITINPNRADTASGTRDTTTLSGGERSFSTVCLLLALWEAMESPFRAMDEFDVFMDAVNRRISMEVLLEAAMEKKHRQHIFLTPQQLQGVTLGPHLKIFRMKPAERNQRTITSMLNPNEGNHDDDE
jgi:chromosome segregation ATPase